ncbi:hypothetical protein DK26_01510 [Bosea sp. WAO]|uniref:DUF6894 family protein n=1 Tax=Bosea sp. WAO TaxID=406341 RepID=UPI00074635F0|nr:hypothetical protein [Bosea sp. WAO]KUL97369.1 hypothetical protein DK26_01510 [Bosea sp. WAO]
MPLYRFAVTDGQHLDRTDAIELSSETVAVKEAHRALAELIADLPNGARAELRISVENETGEAIYQAQLTFRGEAIFAGREKDGETKL